MQEGARQAMQQEREREATEATVRMAVGKGRLATAESKHVSVTDLTGNCPNYRFLSLRSTDQHLRSTQLPRDTFSTSNQTAN